MKKVFYTAAMFALIGSAISCNKQEAVNDKPNESQVVTVNDEETFTGVIPAADAEGVRFTLSLDYDDEGNGGDYNLIQTYLVSDGSKKLGFGDRNSFVTEGKFFIEKSDKSDAAKYLKLVPDKRFADESQLYLLVDSDTTLTLVDSNLQRSENKGLNYTLKRAY